MWQDNAAYAASSSQNAYYGPGNQPNMPLQFYDQSSFYPGSRSSLEGNAAPAQGSIVQPGASGYTGSIQPAGGWWTAFGTGGFEGEPPLLEGAFILVTRSASLSHHTTYSPFRPAELGINFSHIKAKSMTVLNPFRRVEDHIMDDADLAGPLIFCFCFATFLLFVRSAATRHIHHPLTLHSPESHSSGTSMVLHY
jgi:protein YIPF5/7